LPDQSLSFSHNNTYTGKHLASFSSGQNQSEMAPSWDKAINDNIRPTTLAADASASISCLKSTFDNEYVREDKDEDTATAGMTASNASSLILAPGSTIRMSHTESLNMQHALLNEKRSALAVNYLNAPRWAAIKFSEQAQRILDEPNAGGNSEKSEAMSCEIMRLCFGAKLLKTEMGIQYMWGEWSKRTDYLAQIFRRKIGVSVTRAYKHHGEFTAEDAQVLFYKKLKGVNLSSKDVIAPDTWVKQVLHVFTTESYIGDLLVREYAKLSAELTSNTIVLITVAEGANWIMSNWD